MTTQIAATENKINWSNQQLDVFGWFATPQQSAALVVMARAGTGKTTSIVEALNRCPASDRRILACAFNKTIERELTSRITDKRVTVKTLHGAGYGVMIRAWGYPESDGARGTRIAREVCGSTAIDDAVTMVAALASIAKGTMPFLGSDRSCYGSDLADLTCLAEEFGHVPDEAMSKAGWDCDRVVKAALECMRAACRKDAGLAIREDGSNGKTCVDFDDMTYLPVRLGLARPTYDLTVVDEAQDMSPTQILLAQALTVNTGRMVYVGDDAQCQPPGTMISMSGGITKKIEDVQVGEGVISFDRRTSVFVGSRPQGAPKILAKESRRHVGKMITVHAGAKKTDCTPNHIWIARFNDRTTKECVVYLMKKGNRFRVGWCQLFGAGGGLHLGQRTRIEKADAAWILKVFNSRTEASIYESYVACRYSIPTIPFEEVRGAEHMTSTAIDSLFAMFPDGYLTENAEHCLNSHGRLMEYPFYQNHEGQRKGRTTIFETHASNLLDIMSVPVYDNSQNVSWCPITLSSRDYDGVVYSLKTQYHETYVADGISTHNCIYGFRGADVNVLSRVVEDFGATVLPLNITRRCPKSVVALATKIVPDFAAAEDAPDGIVDSLANPALLLATAKPGDAILSRKNAPLAGLCLALLRNGVRARIEGRDIGATLCGLVRKVAGKNGAAMSMETFSERLNKWADRRIAKLIESAKKRGDVKLSDDKVNEIADQRDTILALAEDVETVSELCDKVSMLFSNAEDRVNQPPCVVLSSIHKAKGKEWGRVFVLMGTLRNGGEEDRLRYVAYTRAKAHLTLCQGFESKRTVE